MQDRQRDKILYLYKALKEGWQVQMVPGKTSSVFELTRPLTPVEAKQRISVRKNLQKSTRGK